VTARLLIGDVFDRMAELPDHSFDLIVTSPPFLALRSYLPDGHPDKAKEIGSEATPAEFLDTMLALTAEWRRLLAPHGSIAIELGDTYAGSGGAGGDYYEGGFRDGQPGFTGSASASRDAFRDANARHWREKNAKRDGWPLEKSLCGIPTLYAWSLAYGRNLLTGQPSPAGQWRVRNLKPWIRSNPPVGALGDKERPATSFITVACVSSQRWFDLDAVRTIGPSGPNDADVDYRNNKKPVRRTSDGREDRSAGLPTQNVRIRYGSPAGAPPLDWVVDADLVIDTEIDQRAGKPNGGNITTRAGKKESEPDRGGMWSTFTGGYNTAENGTVGARGVHIRRRLQTAGILPPFTDAYDVSPKGYAGMTRPTTRLVPCGPHDGGLRTTSRGCPVHGDQSAPVPTAPDGAHAETAATRTPRNGDHPVQGQLDDSVPTVPRSEPTIELPSSDSPPRPCAPAATSHSTASNRTAPAPSTSPADTPSAETTGRTARTPASPSSGEPHPDTLSSRTDEADQPSPESETDDGTAGTPDPLAACTCSYHLAVNDGESTSHYAVWPPELVKLLIDEMCPRRVCVECGEPSRWIVRHDDWPTRTTDPLINDGGNGTHGNRVAIRKTLGWSDCGHDQWRHGTVLDPFVGSGTTLAVASGMGRDSVGIDLDERNADLARERVGMFLEVDYPDREAAS
jgi:hypothetical protein